MAAAELSVCHTTGEAKDAYGSSHWRRVFAELNSLLCSISSMELVAHPDGEGPDGRPMPMEDLPRQLVMPSERGVELKLVQQAIEIWKSILECLILWICASER